MSEETNSRDDRALGMNSEITRRDFLGSTLLASGAALLGTSSPAQLIAMQAQTNPSLDWNGFSGVGEYAGANGNTWEVLTAGHKLRDATFEKSLASAQDTGEIFGCTVIGGRARRGAGSGRSASSAGSSCVYLT